MGRAFGLDGLVMIPGRVEKGAREPPNRKLSRSELTFYGKSTAGFSVDGYCFPH